MNFYSGLAHITIPHANTVNRVYMNPRYRTDPVTRVGPSRHRFNQEQSESEIGRLAKSRMTERLSAVETGQGAGSVSSAVSGPRQVSSEQLGSFFDSYA